MLVIVDPPRSGMHKNTVDDVIKLNPAKIGLRKLQSGNTGKRYKIIF